MNQMSKKDKDNLTGLILKCLDQMQFKMLREDRNLVPLIESSTWNGVYSFIKTKLSWIEDIYEEKDIMSMIAELYGGRLLGGSYEDLRNQLSRYYDEHPSEIDDEKKKFLEEQGDDDDDRVKQQGQTYTLDNLVSRPATPPPRHKHGG